MIRSLALVALVALPAAAQHHATEADRSAPVPVGAATPTVALKAAAAALPNGLSLSLLETHRLPLVAVTLIIPQASPNADPVGREGLSDLVAAMMKEGVAGLPNAAAFSDAVDDLGASISVGSSDAGLTVNVVVLKKNLDQALGLVSRMVLAPNSATPNPESAAALERLRQQSLTGLAMAKADPEKLAGRRLNSDLFGDGPHGRSATEASVAAITPADVAAAHRAGVVPNGAVLAFAGDLTLEEMKAVAEKNFGAWNPASLPPAPKTPTATAVAAAKTAPVPGAGPEIVVIDIPGEQAEMMLGLKVLERTHPDYDALSLAIGVLGGPMIGRLDQNIRETHHWAYGARAGLAAFKDAGRVEMESKVQVDKTADALREILGELRRLGTDPVPDAELLAAKTYMKGSMPRAMRTVQSLAARLAGITAMGLPPETLNNYAQRMDALTAAQVQAAAAKWLSPDQVRIVIAGPAAQIVPQLQGAGTVRVFDAEGKELPGKAG